MDLPVANVVQASLETLRAEVAAAVRRFETIVGLQVSGLTPDTDAAEVEVTLGRRVRVATWIASDPAAWDRRLDPLLAEAREGLGRLAEIGADLSTHT